MTPFSSLSAKLTRGEIAILDGAMGTEIQRRGVSTELPLWSAGAIVSNPEVIRQIHADYIAAGADIIRTNTFRTNERTLLKGNLPASRARDLTLIACRLAKEARDATGRTEVCIAGGTAPLEDCYHPELVPSEQELHREHALWAASLAEGGVDFIFVETMNCIREAKIATEEAAKTGLPVAVSFLATPEGKVFSGESVEDLVNALKPFSPFAILLNCRPPEGLVPALDALLSCNPVVTGVYANGIGKPDDKEGWIFEESGAALDAYVSYAEVWRKKGARIIGACCGSTPEYIARIAKDFSIRTSVHPAS